MELRSFLIHSTTLLLCSLWPISSNAFSLRSIRQVRIPPRQQQRLGPSAQFNNSPQLPPQLAPSQQIQSTQQKAPPPQFGAPQLGGQQQPPNSFPNFASSGLPPPHLGPGFSQNSFHNILPTSQPQLPQQQFIANGFVNPQNQLQQQQQAPSPPAQQPQQQPNNGPVPQQQQLNNAPIAQQQQNIPQQQQLLPPPPRQQPKQPNAQEGPLEQPLQLTTLPTQSTPRIVPAPVDRNVDLDGDGALSVAEVQYAAFVHHGLSSSVVENLFNQVDKNKDGYLTSVEFNEIRPLVLAKAENAALRYLQSVDTDHNGLLSLEEAQNYILKEYGISNRDVERIWRLTVPSSSDEMDAVLFSKLRRRIRGMSIRLARQIMKIADKNEDGHIDLKEAQMIAFEQEGIGAGDVIEMTAGVDDNNDGELNAPEFADFQRIVRARAVETSKKALKVVDTDASDSLTMSEAKQIAFDHYGFDEATLEPFFAQADENEDGQLDAVEFAGFRSVIRSRAVKNALTILPDIDEDGDGLVSIAEAEKKARREDDLDVKEIHGLFNVADQDRSGSLDKVELADFVRLVRLSAIKYVNDHFRDYDKNRDKLVTIDELEQIVKDRYGVEPKITKKFFDMVDVDRSGDLNAGEIVDFRHEIRRHVADRSVQAELDVQNRREMAEIEAKLRMEAEEKNQPEKGSIKEAVSERVPNSEDENSDASTPVKTATTKSHAPAPTTVAAEKTDKHRDAPANQGGEQLSGETNSSENESEESVHTANAEDAKADNKSVATQQPMEDDAEQATSEDTVQSSQTPAMEEEKIESTTEAPTTAALIESTTMERSSTSTTTTSEPLATTEEPQTTLPPRKKAKKNRRKQTTEAAEMESAPTQPITTSSPSPSPTTTQEPETTSIPTDINTSPQSSSSPTEAGEMSTSEQERLESDAAQHSTSSPTRNSSEPVMSQNSEATTTTEEEEASSAAPEETTSASLSSLPTSTPSTTTPSGVTHKRRKSKKNRTTTTTTTTPAYDDEGEEEGSEEAGTEATPASSN